MAKIVYWARLKLARTQIEQVLRQLPGVELVIAETVHEVVDSLPGTEGIVLPDCPAAEATVLCRGLAAADTLAWMCFITSGRDGVIAGGIPAGVEVDGVSGAAAPTVAEHAMALLLAVGRQLPAITLTNQLRSWDRGMAAGLRSLEGQTMLVVGLGRIGGEVATRARAFGMRVVAVTRTPREHPAVDVTLPLPELTSALGLADSIVIAVAHTPQTHHLFGRREFVACKPSAVLVNVARGGVVNQPALAEALRDGRLAGAGLDVTDPEPLPPGDPLWDAPRLVISPHLASSGSLPSEQRLADAVGRRVASHCRRASESKWPENG